MDTYVEDNYDRVMDLNAIEPKYPENHYDTQNNTFDINTHDWEHLNTQNNAA